MAIGLVESDPEPAGIEILDWHELYAREEGDDAIIPGLAFRGRWTAVAAPAKAGKSTVFVGLIYQACQAGYRVLYLDAEMGRTDMLDRVEEWMQLKPDDLTNLHYTDLPPKLDTVEGASRLGVTVERIQPDIVVLDGLNGVANGAENDDTTWRDMYEMAIAPMKALNIAVVSADNTGHMDKKRPRGSSVKLDKADGILALERTDNGVKLEATHRRTAAYPLEQHYIVRHAEPGPPAMTVHLVGGSEPEGTSKIVALLDRLDAPPDIGIRAARRLVREHGIQGRNEAIDAAVRRRKTSVPPPWGTLQEPPAYGVCPDGVPTQGTPPSTGPVDNVAKEPPTFADAGLPE
jgi:KaiC/GvpD/RAD55 family RecA-like ATPase